MFFFVLIKPNSITKLKTPTQLLTSRIKKQQPTTKHAQSITINNKHNILFTFGFIINVVFRLHVLLWFLHMNNVLFTLSCRIVTTFILYLYVSKHSGYIVPYPVTQWTLTESTFTRTKLAAIRHTDQIKNNCLQNLDKMRLRNK